MDVLSDIFETLSLRGSFYFRTEFSAPWAVAVPAFARAARFHLVIEGRCHIRLASGADIVLNTGDLLMIPYGQAHVLADAPGRDAPPLETVLEQAGYNGEGVLVCGGGAPSATTRMVCGHFNFIEKADHPLIQAFPEYFVITPVTRAKNPWLDEMLRLIVRRVFSEGPGAIATILRLSEIIFIETIRASGEQSPALRQILSAFQDPQIGKAIQTIHRRSEQHWTVASLALEVGMSRTQFAERFKEMIGDGPLGYLTNWRLQRAQALLTQSRLSVREVARRSGYASAAAFTRAFRQKFGEPPTAQREARVATRAGSE